MLFNTFAFACFLPIVFALYWVLPGVRARNALLLVASYVFYGWWDARFLALIVISSAVDFYAAGGLERSDQPRTRRLLLALSLAINLGMLAYFKYAGFFVDSMYDALSSVGIPASRPQLRIILPVGISFYTFQTLSYTIDVYRKRFRATSDWLAFFTYVAFFPQLVAGPIERAKNLLPQFETQHQFDETMGSDGMRQILWGLFKKSVIADNAAPYVNLIFGESSTCSTAVLWLGVLLFAFQIYGDFSGYSDIAIGTAKLFGVRLMQNFATPYFSRDIGEFWRRWHISLSSWFKDYVYFPLGGSRFGRLVSLRNVAVIFLVSGFWHGANWTFIVWGGLNALYFLPLFVGGKNRANLDSVAAGRLLPSLRELAQMVVTFVLVLFAWVVFRAESLGHAASYIGGMLWLSGSASNPLDVEAKFRVGVCLGMAAVMFGVEWLQRELPHGLAIERAPRHWRWSAYFAIATLLFFFGRFGAEDFIYFQF